MRIIMQMVTAVFFAALAFTGPALAQTDVNAGWDGAGSFNFNADVSNGADMDFSSGSNQSNWGNINFHNNQDNPHSYGVSTVSNHVDAGVGGGGFIETSFTRDSSASFYGSGGQHTFTRVGTSDGHGQVAVHNSANYAELRQVNWKKDRTDGGHTLEVSGSSYNFEHTVASSPLDEYATITGGGSGSADVTTNASTASSGGWKHGQGAGIFTLAEYNATGSGGVQAYGQADNQVSGFNSSFAGPGASLNFGGTFGSGANIGDFSMSGN